MSTVVFSEIKGSGELVVVDDKDVARRSLRWTKIAGVVGIFAAGVAILALGAAVLLPEIRGWFGLKDSEPSVTVTLLPVDPAKTGVPSGESSGTPATEDTSGPTIEADPSAAAIGDPVYVTGEGFASADEIAITLVKGESPGALEEVKVAKVRASDDGSFSAGVVVPDDIPQDWRGSQTVYLQVRGKNSGATYDFRIL